jgi:AcrR family transcriptional regulator
MTSPEPRKRKQYASRMAPERRREQLLDVALDIAATRGLPEVNMEAIARESGVTKPVVYGVFPNSDAVLEALVEREQRRAQRHLQDAVPLDLDLSDPVKALSVGVAGFLGAVRENSATWRLLLAADQLPEVARAQHAKARQLLVGQLALLAEAGISLRASGPLDPILLARLILVGVEEAARLVLEDPDTFTEGRLAAFVSELARSIQEG